MLANTYHLYLQPGDEIVKEMGGLNKMMNWHGPTMTDSGGFQVFSLGSAYGKGISKVLQITDPCPNGSSGRASLLIPERFDDTLAPRLAKVGQDGVSFTSHLDGSVHYITPEKSIQIQHNLGADIIFAFDECTSPAEDLKYQEEALERTHAWARRSLEEHHKIIESSSRSHLFPSQTPPQGETFSHFHSVIPAEAACPARGIQDSDGPAIFGIVQGGREETLRKKSAKIISEMEVDLPTQAGVKKGFDGFGIGGSFAKEDMST
ncbi:MAG: tRNA guanosine(34) transglycosylase Tgt, partial [Candidatus Taylorbacteria bacterium]|nr:tRNA guanosine(34) transglycosylase Tgt [Candidatus Taylorbacteria bacterium]